MVTPGYFEDETLISSVSLSKYLVSIGILGKYHERPGIWGD